MFGRVWVTKPITRCPTSHTRKVWWHHVAATAGTPADGQIQRHSARHTRRGAWSGQWVAWRAVHSGWRGCENERHAQEVGLTRGAEGLLLAIRGNVHELFARHQPLPSAPKATESGGNCSDDVNVLSRSSAPPSVSCTCCAPSRERSITHRG